MKFNHITLTITDLERSKAFYRALGLTQIVEAAPRYGRFIFPDGDTTLSVEVTGREVDGAAQRATLFFECPSVDETVAAIKARGLAFEQEPADMFYLWREAILRDPDGHEIRLYSETLKDSRLNPPWKLKEPAPAA